MSIAARIVPAQLSGIVGDANLLTDPKELLRYQIDGKRPTAVVRPGSTEEIAEILKYAHAEKLAIVIAGARTKLAIGLPPREYDIALDMTRLDRILAYDPGDLTLSVEGGIPLVKVQNELAKHGQFLPLAVPFLDRTTVGGTIASGVDSPLRQFYGTARDYILGMEFVTGEGIVAKSGGRVVKNVTGYDMHKLLAGSLGTLAVITKINLRTFPRPLHTRGFIARFEKAERALAMRHHIAQLHLTPLTIEILSPKTAELFAGDAAARVEPNEFDSTLFSNKHWTLATSFAGKNLVLERYERELRQMAEQSGAVDARTLSAESVPGAFGRLREFVPIALESSPAATIVKMSVLPSRMNDILFAAGKAANESDLPWAAMARGVGMIHLALLPIERNDQALGKVAQATSMILASCASLEGNVTIPWCPAEWKASLNVWGPVRGDFELMRKVKTLFDPGNILSPGRFAGGI
jgi:glycolate oxidase FAD binding subunit